MREKMMLLFDAYHEDSQRLLESFRLSGCPLPAAVINEDGYLPDGVQSVYGYFLGDFSKAGGSLGRPRYFNEIDIPDYWEIEASSDSGTVKERNRERARIYFHDASNARQVKAVDWLDEWGKVRYTDHYNRWGAIYACTVFTEAGAAFSKSFFSADGREVLVENYVTGDITFNDGETVRLFHNKTELVAYYLKVTGYDRYRLVINSLSIPFFVTGRLEGEAGQNVLFWQEPVRSEIPGNMQMILDGRRPQIGRIYVQNRHAYQRLLQLGADPRIVREKGFVYPFLRENLHRPQILICTDSDQIENLRELVTELPEAEFHIAAVTLMSEKLLSMESFKNVQLYPCIKKQKSDSLFEQCDIYLDINHGKVILDSIQRAFLNRQVIFGFRETLHGPGYMDVANIYSVDEAEELIQAIRQLISHPESFDEKVREQQSAALAEEITAYQEI